MTAATSAAVLERGVVGVTASEVVARAGVSRRTFYEIFDGVEDCLQATFDDTLAAASERVLSAYDQSAPWRARIRAGLAALLGFLDEEPTCAHLLLVDLHTAGPRARARRERVLAALSAAVDEGRSEGSRAARLPPLTAEGVVGGALEILGTRVRAREHPLLELCGPLMATIVLPYLGPAAARHELDRPVPEPAQPAPSERAAAPPVNPLDGLPMRLTYRTICVLRAIATEPGASNRQVGSMSGIVDQGQISKLLARLRRLGLIDNEAPRASERGTPNKWTLTERGASIERATRGMGQPGG
jgi:AcrR family transcriptional regulator